MFARHAAAGLAALALSTTLALAPSDAHADDAIAWMPADTAMVLSVDVKGLQKTALYTEVMGFLRQEDEFAGMVREMRDQAGFDLEKDLERIVLAVPADADTSENFLVVATGTFDEKQIVAAFEKESSEKLTATKHDGQTYWAFESEGATLFDGGTMLFGTKTSVKAAIDAKKSGKSALAKPLPGLLKGVDQSANLWWVGAFPSSVKQMLGAQLPGGDFETTHGSLDFTGGMKLATTLGLSTEAAATQIHTTALQLQNDAAKDPTVAALGMDTVVSKAALSVDGKAVSVTLDLDETEFDAFKTSVIQMFFTVGSSSGTTAVPRGPAPTKKPKKAAP